MSTDGKGEVFRMNTAMGNYLLGDSFSGISDVNSFWDFMTDGFVPAISQNGTILGFNNIIGNV